MSLPVVSICCLTYNHAPFIRKCLDGFLMQQVDVPFEILIHDDASSDGTQEIIKEYQATHPDLIKPIIQAENQYSKGMRGISFHFNFPRAKGKYIAMCEGDDYWTDPYKLQKQVEFLEYHPDCMLTCGGFIKVSNGLSEETVINGIVSSNQEDQKGFKFTLIDLSKRWLTKTLTCVFRNDQEVFDQILNYKYTRDIHLFYHVLKNGFGYYFKQPFGVYNVHSGGLFSLTAETIRLSTHYKIYRELYEVNGDEFSREMYFKLLLKIISFNRSNAVKTDFRTGKIAIEASKIVRTGREGFNLLKAFIPRKVVLAIKRKIG